MGFSRERETEQDENGMFILPDELEQTEEVVKESKLPVTNEQALVADEDVDEEEYEEDEDQEEEYVAPEDQKVFGMPRFCFWGVMFGFAMGYILCGLVGMITNTQQSNSIYIAGCGIAGYVVAYVIYKRKKKAQALESDHISDDTKDQK